MRLILICTLLLLSACERSAEPPPAEQVAYKNDYVIGHYAASASGRHGNSFWIEGPEGVVLIGTQLLPEDTRNLLSIAESYTGKKAVMAIVLHASPGQFNGAGLLKQRGIRVVSAASVVEQIPARHESALETYGARLGQAYPKRLSLPEAAWHQTGFFDAAGLRFRAYVVRAGESASHVLIELDHHLFVGDLVVNGFHAPLRLGRSKQWIERLQEIQQFAAPRVIHPGRGYAMNGAQLLEQQIAYLRFFRQAVAAVYSGGRITPADRVAISDRLRQRYPDYPLDEWLAVGIDAEWEALRQRDHMMF